MSPHLSCLPRKRLLDEYFIENRTKLLDIAAFMDRLDRAAGDEQSDFRLHAFIEALELLAGSKTSRVQAIQMLFSDPTTNPLDKTNAKNAVGAYDNTQGVATAKAGKTK
jgi:alanine-alpha-ketoisovalerate/valine-pyruvate aminotransferase